MAKGMHGKIVDRDLGWNELFTRAKQIKNSFVRVGVLAETPKGSARVSDGLSVAEYAAINEFGSDTIPSRPAFRMTFDANRERLVALGQQLMKQVLGGSITVERALNLIGLDLATAVKKTITTGAGVPPPNAESTIRQKMKRGAAAKHFKKKATDLGSALAQVGAAAAVRTLVDTGRLVGAITWAVVMGRK